MNAAANQIPMTDKSGSSKKSFRIAALALSVVLGLGITLPAQALQRNTNPPSLLKNAPGVYIVKKGDTLWDIAGHYLKKPWRWPEIWVHNKHVKNPHWIFPGDRLLICVINGRTVVGKDEGDGCAGIARRMNNNGLPVVKLYPQVRVEPLDVAVPLIPLKNIEHWLKHSQVIPAAEIANTPYVVGSADNRVIAAAGQRIYVRGQGLTEGQTYGVFHEGLPYLADNGKTNLGIEMTQMATGVVTQITGDIATIELQQSFDGEVRLKDRVLPLPDATLPDMFFPTQPDQVTAGGKVIRVLDSISAAAKGSVIALDRGIADGAAPGQVFAIYQHGQQIKDPKTGEKLQLPSERIGLAMIFRSYDRVSYAYVLESELPIKVQDDIRSPLGDLDDEL